MKNYIFLFTMFFALSLNLTATEPPQKQQPTKTETATQSETTQVPTTGLPEAAQSEAEQDSTIIITPPPGGVPTVNWLFSQANVIYMALLYLLGWLSGYLPFLKKLDDKRLRILILGLILGAGLIIWQVFQKDLNWQDFAGLVMAFVATQLGYQYILSPIPALKTPEPEKTK